MSSRIPPNNSRSLQKKNYQKLKVKIMKNLLKIFVLVFVVGIFSSCEEDVLETNIKEPTETLDPTDIDDDEEAGRTRES